MASAKFAVLGMAVLLACGLACHAKPSYTKRDLKSVRCQSCQSTVLNAVNEVKKYRSAYEQRGMKLIEAAVAEVLEGLCDPRLPMGEWLQQASLVPRRDGVMAISFATKRSACKDECWHVARACVEVQERTDMNELSAALFWDVEQGALIRRVCFDGKTKFCKVEMDAEPPSPDKVDWSGLIKVLEEDDDEDEEL